MKIAIFCHSLISDHFLRGICSELISRGNEVLAYEPEDSWSYQNLLTEQHEHYFTHFERAYPMLKTDRYRRIDLDRMPQGVNVAIVMPIGGGSGSERIALGIRRCAFCDKPKLETGSRSSTNWRSCCPAKPDHFAAGTCIRLFSG